MYVSLVGDFVDFKVGKNEGFCVETARGSRLGAEVGLAVGASVGLLVGMMVGIIVDLTDGALLGECVAGL